MPPAAVTLFGAPRDSIFAAKTFWITLLGPGFSFPLCCLPSVAALRHTSLFGLCTIVYARAPTATARSCARQIPRQPPTRPCLPTRRRANHHVMQVCSSFGGGVLSGVGCRRRLR
jgi:hypothetical protein